MIRLMCLLALLMTGLASARADTIAWAADATDFNDNQSSAIWRAYSKVRFGRYANQFILETWASRSSNGGSTFSDVVKVNSSADQSNGITHVNETPSIAYVPANSARPWVLVWDDHYLQNGQVMAPIAWLGMRTAVSPAGPWSTESKLLAPAPYNPANPLNPGAPSFALPPQMQDCMYLQETAIYPADTGFFLSADCVSPNGRRVEFLRVDMPTLALTYLGTLISPADVTAFAQRYGGNYPNAPFAVTEGGLSRGADGLPYFLATPVTKDSQGHPKPSGCVVIPMADLNSGLIARDESGAPLLQKTLGTQQGTGGCSYASNSIAGGVSMNSPPAPPPNVSTTGQIVP